jgi:hypothetical protein
LSWPTACCVGASSWTQALDSASRTYDQRGLTAFDAANATSRHEAAAITLDASLDLLDSDERHRYGELAVFPEDALMPLETVGCLWQATGGLNRLDTEDLCMRLFGLSLLLDCDLATHRIRLHDVVRRYLTGEHKADLPALHGQLLDSYQVSRWDLLPPGEPYLWDRLAYHLVEAGRGDELLPTMKDLRYLVNKTCARSAYAAEADLVAAENHLGGGRAWRGDRDDPALRLLRRQFANITHLLNRCEAPGKAAETLHCRLQHLDALAEACQVLEGHLEKPYIGAWHSLPDLPHPALIRTLAGHTGSVRICAVSPDGRWIISASWDRTLKVWDAITGEVHLTFTGHMDRVTGCAVSPDGHWIVSAPRDRTLKVWDAITGEVRLTLTGHTGIVTGCAVSPSGHWIVSASSDKTLKVWDAATGEVRFTLTGHTDGVRGCSFSPDGRWIVSASRDKTLKVWDVATGQGSLTLAGHAGTVRGSAISPDGRWIVSASYDRTLKVWDASTGHCLTTFYADGPLFACAVHPDGQHIIAAGGRGVYWLQMVW